MLEGVVKRGTASKFKHNFYQIAGKSGTANKVVNGKYTHDTYTSFVGYFPAESPRYSCIVVIDSPQRYAWHFGASVATVVKDIADKIAAKDLFAQPCMATETVTQVSGIFPLIRAGHRATLLQLCDTLGIAYYPEVPAAMWVKSTIEDQHIVWKANGVTDLDSIPQVLGMTLKDALFLLENCGIQVTIQGNKGGRVKAQALLPGASNTQGQHVMLDMH